MPVILEEHKTNKPKKPSELPYGVAPNWNKSTRYRYAVWSLSREGFAHCDMFTSPVEATAVANRLFQYDHIAAVWVHRVTTTLETTLSLSKRDD